MVLVFSDAANNSDEIKKELSLASRYRVPVLALRIEDVEPSDAFAYELSTRQWIDAFAGWDKSLDALARKIGQISDASIDGQEPANGRAPVVSRPVRLSKAMIAGTALDSYGVRDRHCRMASPSPWRSGRTQHVCQAGWI